MAETKIQNISLSKIHPNPNQPRKYFDPDAMDMLTNSIERYGVLSPITVRPADDGEYELISGERRYRAAFTAGLRTIPCIIIYASFSDCAILSLLENLQREDLSFLEIAESYRELVKDEGFTSRDLSRKLGDRPFVIKERMNLMRLDPIVRKYVRTYRLSERQACALLKIKNPRRQIDAAREICENGLNEAETSEFISAMHQSSENSKIHINKIKDIKLLRNTLSNAVSLLQKSGIQAEFSESTNNGGQVFTIFVKD